MYSQFYKGINKKSMVLAMIAVFVFVFLFDWLVHGHLLMGIYNETASLWRTQEQMKEMCIWMIIGYVLLAKYFTFIYARGCEKGNVAEGARYGTLAGMLLISGCFISYAIMPIPQTLLWYSVASTLFKSIVAGMIAGAIYKKA